MNQKIVYITRDIERALGTEPSDNYHIVCNETPFSQKIKEKYPNSVHIIPHPSNNLLGTSELLSHQKTKEAVAPDSKIIVFKNTSRVEAEINANKWITLNPKAYLAERVENKLSQVRWLGELTKYLPSHIVKQTKTISWKEQPFIIQWAHGHTGDSTLLIKEREELVTLQEKFPERMARLTNFIEGPSFTVNVVVAKNKILMGNISYQITGIAPFTDNQFSTIGNDWGFAHKFLTSKDLESIQIIVKDIGLKLQKDGWKGLFGIDFIMDEKSRRIFLIEINARQPASATYESFLEEKEREKGVKGITTFEAHLRALQDLPIDQDIIAVNDGAQIIQRYTKSIQGIFDDIVSKLEKKGYTVIAYQDSLPNSDLLRVQSRTSLIENHNVLNDNGLAIAETIKAGKLNLEV